MFLNLQRSYKANLKSTSELTEVIMSAVASFEHHGTQKGDNLSVVPRCGMRYSSRGVLGGLNLMFLPLSSIQAGFCQVLQEPELLLVMRPLTQSQHRAVVTSKLLTL